MPLRQRRKEFRGRLERPDYGRLLLEQREEGYFRKWDEERLRSRSVKVCRRVFILISSLLLLGGIAFTLF